MPLVRKHCDCGNRDAKCPECGEGYVTVRDGFNQNSPNDLVDYGGDTEAEYTHLCWGCGWTEKVTITVEREEVNE